MARIGVLALQGGFAAHARALTRIGHAPVEVRAAEQLAELAGLVLPGGESTTQLKLIDSAGLQPRLDDFVRGDRPVLATCSGLILAARRVVDPEQRSYGWLDLVVRRNAYGRQLESFEATSAVSGLPLVFIRAPRIVECGPLVEICDRCDDEPILVRQGAFWGATFHPELTENDRVHEMVFGGRSLG